MIGVAMIGLGWWGKKLSQSIAPSRIMRVVRGIDPNGKAAAGFAETCGFPIGSHYEEALGDPAVDAVVLATRLNRPVHFLAMSPLFRPWLRGVLMRAVGALPVYRQRDDPALNAK